MKQLHWFQPKSLLDKFFEASVIVKGIEGVLETLAGFFVLFVGSQSLAEWAIRLSHHELVDDPTDLFANYIMHTGQHLASGGTTFLVAYLLVHGLIKLTAVGSLMLNKLWGYPFSMATLGLFMLYQIYEISLRHSVFMIVLTIFDIFLMWLIYREWQQQKANQGKGAE
ncbi:MAG: DUF2127 domain-containing protein [Candidatus Saccharimonadales bacterium]